MCVWKPVKTHSVAACWLKEEGVEGGQRACKIWANKKKFTGRNVWYHCKVETLTVAVWTGIWWAWNYSIIIIFFFLYSIPNCWLWDSLLWPGVHFSWRAPPNLSATDLVRITPVSGVGFQSWSLSGKLALGSTVDECVHKFTLKASVPYYSAPAHNHFLLLRRAE